MVSKQVFQYIVIKEKCLHLLKNYLELQISSNYVMYVDPPLNENKYDFGFIYLKN